MSGALPDGWLSVELGALLREPLRNGHSAKAAPDGQGIRTLTLSAVTYGDFSPSNTKITVADAFRVRDLWLEQGDILVERSNTPDLVGTARMYRGLPRYAIFPDLLIRVRVREEVALPVFVELALQSQESRTYFKESAQGAAGSMPKIDQGTIEGTAIVLPPLAEQKRIVAKVEELLAEVNAAKERLAKVPRILRRFRQAVLATACSGKLTEEWRATHAPEPIERTLSRINVAESRTGRAATEDVIPGVAILSVGDPATEAPPGWKWVPLTDVAKLESGHTPSRKQASYWNGPVPWIGIVDAGAHHGGVIHDTAQTVTQAGLDNSAARLLPARTVCLSRTASVGYVVIMGRPMATSQDFVNWVCSEALVPEFLMYAIMAEGPGIKRFGRGSTHTTIYFPEVKALHICLPPVDEQREIVRRVADLLPVADQIARAANDALGRVERVPQAVLAQAFRGELVPTEAELARAEGRDYETADQLLARVRGERGTLERDKTREKPATRELSLLTLERNDIDSALAMRADSIEKGTWRPEYDSVLMRLQDDPSALLAALASNGIREADEAEFTKDPARRKNGNGTDAPPHSFEDMDSDARHAAVFAALWPRGLLEKDLAVRTVAEHLRDAGAVTYQRLRADGALYATVLEAIESSVRAGVLDRPRRGHVRATKDAQTMTADDWRHALVTSLDVEPVEREDAIRRAAEWARDSMGVAFERLRSDGHIVAKLRSALNRAIRNGEIHRHGATRVARASAAFVVTKEEDIRRPSPVVTMPAYDDGIRRNPPEPVMITDVREPRVVDGDKPVLVLQYAHRGDEREKQRHAMRTITDGLSAADADPDAEGWVFYFATERPHVEGLTTWLGIGSRVPPEVVDGLQERLEFTDHRVRREYAVPERHGLAPFVVVTDEALEYSAELDDEVVWEPFEGGDLTRRPLVLRSPGKSFQLQRFFFGEGTDE
jgi:type I restriction enzyme S subunit